MKVLRHDQVDSLEHALSEAERAIERSSRVSMLADLHCQPSLWECPALGVRSCPPVQTTANLILSQDEESAKDKQCDEQANGMQPSAIEVVAAQDLAAQRHTAALFLLSMHCAVTLTAQQLTTWMAITLPVTPMPFPTLCARECVRSLLVTRTCRLSCRLLLHSTLLHSADAVPQ